jgi:hypothetical protein
MIPDEGKAALMAVTELVGRTGAREFTLGYIHDDVPAVDAAWYAHAQYKGYRITEENHPGPIEAAEALARRLLTGARCACGKLVSLDADQAFAFRVAVMTDGSTFTSDDAQAAGLCRWTRHGEHWVSACGRRGRE